VSQNPPDPDPGPAANPPPGDGAGDDHRPDQHQPIKAVPVRHPGQWIAGAVLLLLGAMLIHSIFFATVKRGNSTESRFQWNVVGQYVFSAPVVRGMVVTLELTVIAMAAGIVIGVILAVMRLSSSTLLSTTSWLYIWFFRGTPVLVQLFFWYVGISYLFPQLSLGVPFGPSLINVNVNALVTPFVAAVVGLSLNEGAYMAEIVRAGILSVDEGQVEAAKSIGMRRSMSLRLIVLPQAMRLIIPPTGNEVISMLKTSSLASVVTVAELFFATQTISNRTYQIVPLLLVASLWYLFITSILTVGQYFVERRYARGSARPRPPRLLEKLGTNLFSIRPRWLGPSPLDQEAGLRPAGSPGAR
jgi:polar amino acid transport system permease protein